MLLLIEGNNRRGTFWASGLLSSAFLSLRWRSWITVSWDVTFYTWCQWSSKEFCLRKRRRSTRSDRVRVGERGSGMILGEIRGREIVGNPPKIERSRWRLSSRLSGIVWSVFGACSNPTSCRLGVCGWKDRVGMYGIDWTSCIADWSRSRLSTLWTAGSGSITCPTTWAEEVYGKKERHASFDKNPFLFLGGVEKQGPKIELLTSCKTFREFSSSVMALSWAFW